MIDGINLTHKFCLGLWAFLIIMGFIVAIADGIKFWAIYCLVANSWIFMFVLKTIKEKQ